jgi:hypothetical protein
MPTRLIEVYTCSLFRQFLNFLEAPDSLSRVQQLDGALALYIPLFFNEIQQSCPN